MKSFFAPLVLAAALLFQGCAVDNKYERGQKATVLLQASEKRGSAFVVSRRNPQHATRLFLWTAAHVVEGSDDVWAVCAIRYEGHRVGERSFSAHVIARDNVLDLALLSLDAPPSYFEPVRFCDSWPIASVGTKVFHVGNFFGSRFPNSVSSGVVSQIDVALPTWRWPTLDQTTAIVEPGSSGGALFDEETECVLGVVVAFTEPGVSFFVPTRTVRLFSELHSVQFAVRGNACPSDKELLRLRESAKTPLTETPETHTVY